MIKILIILIVAITILFVLALCKTAKRADKNAQIILKKHKSNIKRSEL
ncbi:hypothetical protein [Clostridium sp. YIM B02555]|nr:hypothetical protein [Clostridium sp. YIM B02555]